MGKIACMWMMICFASALQYDWDTSGAKLVGLRLAMKGEYPFSVLIVLSHGETVYSNCGGMLLNLDHIISAAQCFVDIRTNEVDKSYAYQAYGGDVRTLSDRKQAREIKQIMVPRSYDGQIDNIGVAKVGFPFEESPALSPIRVASTDKEEFKNAWVRLTQTSQTCSALSWEVTSDYRKDFDLVSNLNATLNVVELEPMTDTECNATAGGKIIGKGQVCLTQLKNSEDFCYGDSGNPLVCNGYVFGLAGDYKKCGPNFPHRFVLLWPYLIQLGISNPNRRTSWPPKAFIHPSLANRSSIPTLLGMIFLLTASFLL